jgi:uncharacterized membrane protein
MTIILIIIGLILGGGMGGVGGAVVGALAGWACAAWIKASDRASKEAERADKLDKHLAAMHADVKDLAARVSALERGAGAMPASANSSEDVADVAVTAQSSSVAATAVPPSVLDLPPVETAPVHEAARMVAPEQSTESDAAVESFDVQGGTAPATDAPMAAPVPSTPPKPPPPPRVKPAPQPDGPGLIERLLEGNIVAKIGVVILFLGVGFLLKLAYDRGMFPPELRLIAVAAAGAVMLFIGKRLLESNRTYAIILMGAAFGLFYLDTFFALKTFALIGPAAGFGLFAILGVATLLTAVRLDARSLATIGMLGAFMAPILASTGGGNHVLLFSYYLLLNLVILAASWFKAWRELNFIGFLFTFAISLIWGYANYSPKHFSTVEPFLVVYFLLYLAIPILFASRQPPQLKGLVDGTLVFGMPLSVAMMQTALTRGMDDMILAWSAAGAALIYAVLARLLWNKDKMRLLAEAHLSLAVVFGTVAPYFAFRGYPTFAFWTLESAAIFWMGCRQNRILGRAFALFLQIGAAAYFWWVIHDTIDFRSQHAWFNDRVIGGLLIAGSALLTAWFMQRYRETISQIESQLEVAALAWGGAWLLYALAIGIGRQWEGAESRAMAALLMTAMAFMAIEAIGSMLNWTRFRQMARAHLPLLGVLGIYWGAHLHHPLQGGGLLAWPTAFVAYFFVLHRQRAAGAEAATGWRYAGAWTLMVVLATWEVLWRYDHREYWWVFGIGAAGLMASAARFALRGGTEKPLSPGGREVGERGIDQYAPTSIFTYIPLIWSLLVWLAGIHGLIKTSTTDAHQVAWHLAAIAGSVALFELAGRAMHWTALRRTQILLTVGALAVLPVLGHPLRAGQGWAWLVVFGVSWWVLSRQEDDGIATAPGAQHVALIDLLVVLAGWELCWRAVDADLSETWRVAAIGAALAGGITLVRSGIRRDRWPFVNHMTAFAAGSLLPGLVLAGLWTLIANAIADGTVSPWPYVPILNPFDLVQLALFVVAYRVIDLASEDPQVRKPFFIALAALGFWWVNAVILRSVHQWADVPYQLPALLASVVAQTSLSLLWTTTALVMMLAAVKRAHRGWWMCGAALLALVVAKLAFNDLAQSGTVARIVSFIGVGILLLVIGYVAPVPPSNGQLTGDK